MSPGGDIRSALLVTSICCVISWPAGTPLAATTLEYVDPHPAPGNQFGHTVVALSTGNVVVTSPFDDAGGNDAGAVYLFSGSTGALISTLIGSTAGDQIGRDGVTALSNGNYVVRSPKWDDGGVVDAGAVTWGGGTTGVNGVVSAANSLVGSKAKDRIGGCGVKALSNGHYVVSSPGWDNAAARNVGAVTWGNGTSGVTGVVSAANSLVGSTTDDQVGNNHVTALSNGNYVVVSFRWNNGDVDDAGAATWGSGTTGVSGVVSAANSLVGSTANDQVGIVSALSNGNYVVTSSSWDNGAVADAGAATWGSGTTGVNGVISAANSLVGSTAGDRVGYFGVTALTNGNYVVMSPEWSDGALAEAGAVTWGSGITGVIGVVSAANSLVGSTANDRVGCGRVTALSNGNYVVASAYWINRGVVFAGAATWGNGTTGVSGMVSSANSLVGSTPLDAIGDNGVTALTNGNYVVCSGDWNGGEAHGAGAATWGSGTTGVRGVVSAANSLVGSLNCRVGSGGATALSNGNYVVLSPHWNYGMVADLGAATWGSGTTGVTGGVSPTNSLVGLKEGDQVGNGATALSNGNYVVASPNWDNGAVGNVGAATWGSGTTGVTGSVSAANSLVGSTPNDNVGVAGVTALSNGNYAIASPKWDNGTVVDVGAATWGSGTTGSTGVVSTANSLIGTTDTTDLQPIVAANVNGTFIARFLDDGTGRLRVGPLPRPVILSAFDIPADQGGCLRLTFDCTPLEAALGSPPVATHGIWRHVPGALPASARAAEPSAANSAQPDTLAMERLRAVLPAGLDVREADGKFYVVVPRSPPESAAVFPAGTWELVTSVPALQQSQYVVAIPTISNAAANDFVVTAHTTTPSIWFVSAPASGQSVDNLAPTQPAQLTAHFSNGQTQLQWAANTANDLGSYRVYRGTSADFTPGAENRIANVTSPSHADVGPAGSYYKVSAVDVNGNESGFTLLAPNQTTDAGNESPVVFALEGVWPNPTRGRGLQVTFALPSGAAARLELLDVSGRRVLEREVGSLGAGRHTVNLAVGRRVAPGLYWLRLAQGPNQRTTRVVVSE